MMHLGARPAAYRSAGGVIMALDGATNTLFGSRKKMSSSTVSIAAHEGIAFVQFLPPFVVRKILCGRYVSLRSPSWLRPHPLFASTISMRERLAGFALCPPAESTI